MIDIKVNIYALQTDIPEEMFCEDLKRRLREGGILTYVTSIDRVTDKLQVVTITALSTGTEGAITGCIKPYLDRWLNQEGVDYDSFNIAGS